MRAPKIDFNDAEEKNKEKLGILDVLLDETMGNRLWDIRISLNDGPAVHLNDAPEIDAMNKMRSDKTFQAAILPTVFKGCLNSFFMGRPMTKTTGWMLG